MFERRAWTSLDGSLVLFALAVAGLGIWLVRSTTLDRSGPALFHRQLLWLAVGFAAAGVALLVDYHSWAELSPGLYGLGLLGVAAPLWVGRTIGGARRWIDLGPMSVQPSEFMKVALALLLAYLLARRRRYGLGLGSTLALIGVALVPAAIVALQPDLGTAIVLVAPLGGLVVVGGLRVRALAVLGLVVALTLPVAWFTLLKDYQRDRVKAFLHREQDPRGTSYQLHQSLIAVGSGGLAGKWPREVTQSQLQFLPEEHTDFVFAVLAEQWGFLGCFLLLCLYFGIFLGCLRIARLARDRLGVYIVVGVLSVFSFQVFLNVSVAVGLLPTTGVALPLMSYGGSSLVSFLAALGLVLNVGARRFVN
ncbi:MAG: rod shape-determining protein RodA [Acidobacteria bacterium]|nr:rod shape-determining protein RodA [Acidobacteriota bacterium]